MFLKWVALVLILIISTLHSGSAQDLSDRCTAYGCCECNGPVTTGYEKDRSNRFFESMENRGFSINIMPNYDYLLAPEDWEGRTSMCGDILTPSAPSHEEGFLEEYSSEQSIGFGSLLFQGYEFSRESISPIRGELSLQGYLRKPMESELAPDSNTQYDVLYETPEEIIYDVEKLRDSGLLQGIIIDKIFK